MEKFTETKAKVFAQYLGNACLMNGSSIIQIDGNVIQNILNEANYNYDIILQPLINITDEHAIEMAKLFGHVDGEVTLNRPTDLTNDDIHFAVQVYTKEPKWVSYSTPKYWSRMYENTRQWLQLKGYDVPQYLLGYKTLRESGLAVYRDIK